MRALKILVVAMGVLLVVGVVALGFGIAYRVHHPRAAPPETARVAIPRAGASHAVTLPSGAKLLAAQSDGDRVMVRVHLANGDDELMLLDWRSGTPLSTIEMKSSGGASP